MDEDTDDKDDTKRKTRNLSEKKRRDQFNLLINELSSMVSSTNRKMDKSTVLKSTISFLKNHNDIAIQSRANEIQEDWKPSFLSNEEFTHLFLEALDGFIIVLSSSGRFLYASESITSLLGHFPNDLLIMTLYDIVHEGDHSQLYNVFLNPTIDNSQDLELSFVCHCKRGNTDPKEQPVYEIVQFLGQFRSDVDGLSLEGHRGKFSSYSPESDTRWVFVGTGRLQIPQPIRELSVIDSTKSEFTSRHSLEWKFLFLDHRAPPIIGYLPFEVLGTSGYDYYHVDDLEKVVTCHEALMQKGEGTSCYYRFLTKGQQWIWLQTRFYITYHQWNSKPEFVVCTHRVVSYVNVLKPGSYESPESVEKTKYSRTSPWSSKSSSIGGKREKQYSCDSNSLSDMRIARHSPMSTAGSVKSEDCSSRPSSAAPPERIPNQQQQQSSIYPPQPYVIGQPHMPELPPQRVDLLKRRQEELQQRIVEQQTELRQVTEQLLLAKYGLYPPLVNVTLPYSAVGTPPVTMPCPDVYISDSPSGLSDATSHTTQHPSLVPCSNDGYSSATPMMYDQSPNSTH
ncbi:Circadian locomoter output cycles [Nesidiocoris tenuis]|uniref:Circadian locomoter output cycles n=1 Tax=Nesidiocoris tenuis TaxID=355587 RepID=A0ABN7B177_9HEMI|nr:Circadian locomoter output cycles [Nesidiocoris tenuis]